MAQEQKQENLDSLNLGQHDAIKLLIETEGLGNKESVIFSEKLIKINRKGKKQDRYIMITQHAIYNLKPKKYVKSKRRVSIRDVGMLTLSAISPEFAIHVPSEYDYHFASKSKDKIADILKELYAKQTNDKLLVVYSEFQHLKAIILTKKLAKFENKNSKHAMQETITSMKDVLQEIDDNQYQDSDSQSNDIVGYDHDDDGHHYDQKNDQ